jgi:RimJ/RimL family protein N-acetyltransferase
MPTSDDADFSAPILTRRSAAELAKATESLNARRARDRLPGKIETKRLVLRAPMRGDVPDLVKLADNKTIAERLVRLPSPYTRADAIGFVETYAQRADERPYAITQDGRLIGVVGLTFFRDEPPELGYWLGEPFWGRGIMSEAVRGLLEAAWDTGLVEQIRARALASNSQSLRVLEKAGFQRLREGDDPSGKHPGVLTVFLLLGRPKWM